MWPCVSSPEQVSPVPTRVCLRRQRMVILDPVFSFNPFHLPPHVHCTSTCPRTDGTLGVAWRLPQKNSSTVVRGWLKKKKNRRPHVI